MFAGFDSFEVATSGTTIHGVVGGEGEPLLLLHGYPQTHAMWHKVAERLESQFSLVIPDLRGYGTSGKPETDERHTPYSKRAMALDMHEVMQHFGFTSYQVAGHDRGARVAHRLAVDFADHVRRLAVLDIAPTLEMYQNTSEAFARAYWHWFFLIQDAPFPERLIGSQPSEYWRHKCGRGSAGMTPFSPDALAAYLAAFEDPAVIHGSCEDYRAAASIDLDHDKEDVDAKRLLQCPLLVLWASTGAIERCFDPLLLWRQRATNVTGHAVQGGHYLAEECPVTIASEFTGFFAD